MGNYLSSSDDDEDDQISQVPAPSPSASAPQYHVGDVVLIQLPEYCGMRKETVGLIERVVVWDKNGDDVEYMNLNTELRGRCQMKDIRGKLERHTDEDKWEPIEKQLHRLIRIHENDEHQKEEEEKFWGKIQAAVLQQTLEKFLENGRPQVNQPGWIQVPVTLMRWNDYCVQEFRDKGIILCRTSLMERSRDVGDGTFIPARFSMLVRPKEESKAEDGSEIDVDSP